MQTSHVTLRRLRAIYRRAAHWSRNLPKAVGCARLRERNGINSVKHPCCCEPSRATRRAAQPGNASEGVDRVAGASTDSSTVGDTSPRDAFPRVRRAWVAAAGRRHRTACDPRAGAKHGLFDRRRHARREMPSAENAPLARFHSALAFAVKRSAKREAEPLPRRRAWFTEASLASPSWRIDAALSARRRLSCVAEPGSQRRGASAPRAE